MVLGFGVLGFLGFWVFGCLGFWVFGFLGFWVFGFLGFWVWGLGVRGSAVRFGFRVAGHPILEVQTYSLPEYSGICIDTFFHQPKPRTLNP